MAIAPVAFIWIIEGRKLAMDLADIINEFRREKVRVERAIASLEKLQASGAVTVPERKRSGRKSMSPEERQEVSKRMKKFWADWHNKRRRT